MELNAIKDTQSDILERIASLEQVNMHHSDTTHVAELNTSCNVAEFDEEEEKLADKGYMKSKVHRK